eukprot:10489739-Ditylum_brightwellii.AAC.1
MVVLSSHQLTKGYTAFSRLKSTEQKAFNSTGCLLAIKLSLYKDEESPYLYKQYFHGMLKKDFLALYCVLKVGDRADLSRWNVTNVLFQHMKCSNLNAKETMTKKEIFVLLD